MEKLQNDMIDLLDESNQNWAKKLKEKIEKNEEVEMKDVLDIMSKFSGNNKQCSKSFQEAKVRLSEKGTKKFLGIIKL